jgi:hypothetical protein
MGASLMSVQCIAALLILRTELGPSQGQQRSGIAGVRSDAIAPTLDSSFRNEFTRTRDEIAQLRTSVDSLQRARKPWPERWGGFAIGLVAALSGFGIAAYTASRTADANQRARLETHLYDSLKWFEGGTQKRSIGLSVVEGNWSSDSMHNTWRGVLVNQATYLLSVSDSDTDHERQNLERIRIRLEDVVLTDADRGLLRQSLSQRRSASNRGIPGAETDKWEKLVG